MPDHFLGLMNASSAKVGLGYFEFVAGTDCSAEENILSISVATGDTSGVTSLINQNSIHSQDTSALEKGTDYRDRHTLHIT